MSAHQQMRRMLDELMGTGRNGNRAKQTLHFSSNRVCKCFLLNCCPHDVLSATRCDLGKCPKIHDFGLRADYHAANQITTGTDFQQEALTQLRVFITETDRRAQIAKRRLADAQQQLTLEQTRRLNKIGAIDMKIDCVIAESERLGVEGYVNESLKTIQTVDALHKERKLAEDNYLNSIPTSFNQQQKLRVCEICSSYLGYSEGDERLSDHINGRMHRGFVKIRKKIDELEDLIQDCMINSYLDKEFKLQRKESKEITLNLKNKTTSQLQGKFQRHDSNKRSRSRSPVCYQRGLADKV